MGDRDLGREERGTAEVDRLDHARACSHRADATRICVLHRSRARDPGDQHPAERARSLGGDGVRIVAGRAALITGGSSGIGLAIARALGEDGYGLTVAARRPEKLEAAADELRNEGLDVNSIAVNMTDEDAVAGIVKSHKERFGRLDVMVNNAG